MTAAAVASVSDASNARSRLPCTRAPFRARIARLRATAYRHRRIRVISRGRMTRFPRVDRRTFIKGLGAAALVPGCEGSESPVGVTPELLRARIKTVVVLMMENR